MGLMGYWGVRKEGPPAGAFVWDAGSPPTRVFAWDVGSPPARAFEYNSQSQ